MGREQDLSFPLARCGAIFRTSLQELPRLSINLLVTPKSVEQHKSCKHEVQVALARMHNFDPNDKEACPIWDTVQEAQAFRQMTDGMKYFLGAVGIVTLLLGGLGVMNVMMVAVRERTREIGVRKALGAPAHTILRQFFIEALLIAFLSGGIGLGVAYGICSLVDSAAHAGFLRGIASDMEDRIAGLWAAGRRCRAFCVVSGAESRISGSDRGVEI